MRRIAIAIRRRRARDPLLMERRRLLWRRVLLGEQLRDALRQRLDALVAFVNAAAALSRWT